MSTSTPISALKSIAFACLLIFAAQTSLTAQAPFTISPSNTVDGTTVENGYGYLRIDMVNNLNGDLYLEWENLSNTFSPNWTVTLCDWQGCYANIIHGRVMDVVPAGGSGFLALSFSPLDYLGSGSATFRVWEVGNAASEQILTFTMDVITGIDETNFGNEISVYPNPANGMIALTAKAGTLGAGTVQLTDLSGAIVKVQALNESQSATINVESLSPGMYILHYQTAKGTLTRKVLVNH